MKQAHWGALTGFVAVVIGIGVAAHFITRFIRGPHREDVLRQGFFADWVYVYSLCIAISVALIALFGGDSDVDWPNALGVIGIFGGLGGGCLWKSLKHKAVVSKSGIEISYVLRKKIQLSWKDIKSIRCGFFEITFVLSDKDKKSVTTTTHWGNMHYLIEFAKNNGISCQGFED